MTNDSHENVRNKKDAIWRNICCKRLIDYICGYNWYRMIKKGLTDIIVETLRIRVKPPDIRLKPLEGNRIYK
jgi:hypothetical protein